MSPRLIAVVSAAVLVLQGCSKMPVLQTVNADDLTDGVAKSCSFTPVQPSSTSTVDATITMTNDGWCAYRAREVEGKPFLLGLVTQRPQHGELLIRKWAGETRVEYNPNPGFVGTDKFAVTLRPQTAGVPDSKVQLVANVSRGTGVAAAPVASEEKPAASTRRARPARRRTN